LLYGGVLQCGQSKHTEPVLLLLDHHSSQALHPLFILNEKWFHGVTALLVIELGVEDLPFGGHRVQRLESPAASDAPDHG
jgi:hypothetical protein